MTEISTKQGHWLHTLQELSKRPVRVSKAINGKPTTWVSLTDVTLPVDYRTILHNEVVIDIDAARWKEVRMFAEIVTDTLFTLHIPYIHAYSGGKGIHIHVFFDLSQNQKQVCDQMGVMPKDLRMWLFDYILNCAGVSPTLIGPGKPFDTSCVNWSDAGKGHLIRVFGGKKQAYKTLLTDIPEKKPKNVVFPGDINVWYMPDTLFEEFVTQFKKSQKEKVKATRRYQKASQNFTGTYLNLPCVQKTLEGLPEGQRNAGARIISIASRLDNTSKEEAQKIMYTYADTCSKENISESEYQNWIDWIYSQDDYFWNCRFCKDLALCDNPCTFHTAAFKDVLDFLEDPDLILRIDKILGKRIKKDKKNRMLVFFVCLSAYGSNPLNLFLKGESSIGKTHIAKSVAEYFPQEDVWFIGDMSPKALIHERGLYENGRVYISLENKILVFLETPRKETLEMLKPILSHDRREIEYKIADKKMSGQLGTKSVIIQGWPATIFCTTDHKYLEELSTRSMVATPEVTPEKIADVLDYKGEKYARPWKTHTDEEELLFREALQQLKTGVIVSTPYSKELARRYNHNNGNAPRVMRDFDKLMGLLEMSAFLHQGQRYSFCIPGNGGVQEYCIGNEDDFLIGSTLFETVRESTVTGLPQPVLDFYEYVILPMEGELTYRSMMDGYREYYKRTISQVHLKQKFTDPLVGTGHLLCEKHPTDGRMKIFEKRVSADEMKKTEEYQDFALKDIFSEEDLKVYMDEIRDIVQENGGDNGVCVQDANLFYAHGKNLHHFLEEDIESSRDIKEENEAKKQSCLNLGNLEQIILNCGVGEHVLLDHYDEDTVLQQIPQEDTTIEDVVNRFKDLNKVITTIFVLKEKGQVIAGQGYIRRLSRANDLLTQYDEETVLQMIPEENIKIRDFVDRFENPNKAVDTLLILEKRGEIIASQDSMRKVTIAKTPPDAPGPLNTWTCGMCGVTFKAHIPYEDHRGHAICEDCWKSLTEP